MRHALTWVLTLSFVFTPAFAQSVKAPRLHVLDNGLRVITVEDHSDPLVTTAWSAHVGDSAESPDFAGNSHYLEHLLLFRGTEKFPKNEIGEWANGRGGYFNGQTWYDYTNFEITSASADLGGALERHAQMMFHGAFSGEDFETEKKAVFEELRSGRDRPYGYLYRAAPYRMYPRETFYSRDTIGSIDTVQAATVERVREYYESYYVPNNMTLAIVGDIDTDAVLADVAARFGSYPRSELPPSLYEPVGIRPGITVVAEEREVGKAYFLMAVDGPRASDPEYLPFAVLAEYLSGGQTSLLRSRLVSGKRLLDDVEASAWPRRYAGGWQPIAGETEPSEVVAAVREIQVLLEEVKTAGISARDLEFARNRLLTANRQERDNQLALAMALVQYDAHGDYGLFADFEQRVAKVSAADVQAVANKYYTADNFFLMSIFPPGAIPGNFEQDIRANAAALNAAGSGVQSSVLDSGLTVIREARPGAALESFTVAIRAGDRAGDRAGIAEAAVNMLTRETGKRSKTELQDYLDEQGFSLRGSTDTDGAFITLQLPAGKAAEAMALLAEILTTPAFSAGEWADTQAEMLAAITSQLDEPNAVARDLLAATAYAGTPYGRTLQQARDALAATTAKDLRAFWSRHYTASQIAVAYAGGTSLPELEVGLAPLDKLQGRAPDSEPITIVAANQELRRAAPMPGKTQATLYVAWPAPELTSADWVLWRLAQQAFGGDLAGRLWKLRQDEGLAYSVWCSAWETAEKPLAYVYMATAGEKREAGLAAIHREIGLVLDGLSAAELERVKVSYLAALNRSDSTAARRSARQAAWWLQGLGPQRRSELERIIASASLEEVNRVVRDVIDAESYLFVEAGLVPE